MLQVSLRASRQSRNHRQPPGISMASLLAIEGHRGEKKGESLNSCYLPFNNQRKKPYENLKKRWNSNKTNIKRCGRIDLNVI